MFIVPRLRPDPIPVRSAAKSPVVALVPPDVRHGGVLAGRTYEVFDAA